MVEHSGRGRGREGGREGERGKEGVRKRKREKEKEVGQEGEGGRGGGRERGKGQVWLLVKDISQPSLPPSLQSLSNSMHLKIASSAATVFPLPVGAPSNTLVSE